MLSALRGRGVPVGRRETAGPKKSPANEGGADLNAHGTPMGKRSLVVGPNRSALPFEAGARSLG